MYIIQFLNNFLHKFVSKILPHRRKEVFLRKRSFLRKIFCKTKPLPHGRGFSSFDFCLRKHYLMFAKYLIVLTIWDV